MDETNVPPSTVQPLPFKASPLIEELLQLTGLIDDAGLHRLIGMATRLAEQFPKVKPSAQVLPFHRPDA